MFAALAHPARRQILLSVHYGRVQRRRDREPFRMQLADHQPAPRHARVERLLDVEWSDGSGSTGERARVQGVLSKWAGYFD